jgi:hypothetical protein
MKRGRLAPDVELPDTDGVPGRPSTLLRSCPVVLFSYPVRRGLAAAPVKRRTVVIRADGVVQDVVRSELRMGKARGRGAPRPGLTRGG